MFPPSYKVLHRGSRLVVVDKDGDELGSLPADDIIEINEDGEVYLVPISKLAPADIVALVTDRTPSWLR